MKADFRNGKLLYPEDKGMVVNDKTTSNFSHPENFVVFECVCRLLDKGYRPEHLELLSFAKFCTKKSDFQF